MGQGSYFDRTHWDQFCRLPASALDDSRTLDPETGKMARTETQQEWRRKRVARCSSEFEAARARGVEGTGPNDLSPQQCLCFVAAQDEWREATGVYHWRLHPDFIEESEVAA